MAPTPRREAFRIYYQFLETSDEYFDCAASHHLQGFWQIYGIHLPDEVLEKIYCKNAERLLAGGAGQLASAIEEGQNKESPESRATRAAKKSEQRMHVKPTADFEITGDGSAAPWQQVPWESLNKREPVGHAYDARFKLLYSPRGLYVLMQGSDRKLSATLREDFADLWHEDVFEFFLWTDESQSIYFEYEISPLGYELPILVPNVGGKFLGWRPWHYEGDRKIRKAVTIQGGEQASGAKIEGWTAEIFLPFKLLEPLANVPPKAGTQWRANFYRVDYDDGQSTSWDWARVGPSFHEFRKFGTLVFD